MYIRIVLAAQQTDMNLEAFQIPVIYVVSAVDVIAFIHLTIDHVFFVFHSWLTQSTGTAPTAARL